MRCRLQARCAAAASMPTQGSETTTDTQPRRRPLHQQVDDAGGQRDRDLIHRPPTARANSRSGDLLFADLFAPGRERPSGAARHHDESPAKIGLPIHGQSRIRTGDTTIFRGTCRCIPGRDLQRDRGPRWESRTRGFGRIPVGSGHETVVHGLMDCWRTTTRCTRALTALSARRPRRLGPRSRTGTRRRRLRVDDRRRRRAERAAAARSATQQ
jgi:hypothetical protein